jgi:hypothetical protein
MKLGVPPTERDELIAWLAENDIIPVKKSFGDGFTFRRTGEKLGGNNHLMGKKTSSTYISKYLEVEDEEDLERTRKEIKNHPNW